MTTDLPPERAEILSALSAAGAFCGECGFQPGETGCADCVQVREMYADAVMPIVDRLRALVADFVDPDPCSLDHNGYCQAHGWYSGRPCPHRRAKDLGLEEPLS